MYNINILTRGAIKMSERKFTKKLLKLVDDGELDAKYVLKICLEEYMTEQEVGFMCLDSCGLEDEFDEEADPGEYHCDCCGYAINVCDCKI